MKKEIINQRKGLKRIFGDSVEIGSLAKDLINKTGRKRICQNFNRLINVRDDNDIVPRAKRYKMFHHRKIKKNGLFEVYI